MQCSLLYLLESWRNAVDQKKKTGTIFMDLSKALDTVYYSFLIVKLNVYGFFTDSLKLNFIYLKNRKQWSLRTHGFW